MPAVATVAPAPRGRVLWLAVAEGRGHLMRAHLARELLAGAGIAVDIATTSRAGVAFIAALGGTACELSSKFHLVYDDHQNLSRTRTRLAAMRYLAAPSGCARDLAMIAERADTASMIVNDSFHPALMASVLAGSNIGRRVVHVHCENTRRAIEVNGRHGPLALLVRAAMTRARRIEIVLGGEHPLGEPDGGGTVRLPPLVALPRPRATVRAELGVRSGDRLAVVYLNPYFRDPELASSIEDGLARHKYRVHLVAEGFGDRPGWLARDPRLADAVAAADLFVSAPGAAAVTMARAFGVPMIAVATDQPEQQQNLRALRAISVAGDRAFRERFSAALAARASTGLGPIPLAPEAGPSRARALWLRTFEHLVEQFSPTSKGFAS